MKTKTLKLSLFALTVATLASGCSGFNFATPYTDALKLTQAVDENEKFTAPTDGNNALGEVTICEVVDGDTFNFYNGKNVNPKTTTDVSYTVRFEGVNTPESTARIEPWGVKASQYVKSILWDNEKECQKPYSVVLQNDISVFGQQDSTSTRYLAFVWYKMNENSDYRLLNLEVIEQAYSKNLLSNYSTFCPYLDYFVEAAKVATNNKKRVYGEKDPGYDYTNSIQDVTIHYIRDNYENLGVSSTDTEDSSESGVRVRLTALIVGFSGDSTFVRDVSDPLNNGEYASIYVYTALTITGMAQVYHVGQIITFVGRATTYHGNVQLTDVKDLSTGSADEKITVNLDPYDYGVRKNADWRDDAKVAALVNAAEAKGYHYDVMPYDEVSSVSEISDINNMETYVGDFVKIQLTIRNGDKDDPNPILDEKVEDYYRYDSDGLSLTILAKTSAGARLDIRSLHYGKGYFDQTNFVSGTTYYIIGQVAKYYKGYQIVVPNKNMISQAYGTYGYAYPVSVV